MSADPELPAITCRASAADFRRFLFGLHLLWGCLTFLFGDLHALDRSLCFLKMVDLIQGQCSAVFFVGSKHAEWQRWRIHSGMRCYVSIERVDN